MKKKCSTSVEDRQQIIAAYIAETGSETIDMKTVAAWAMDKGLWQPPRYDPIQLYARELSRAAREEFCLDPQGREVRKRHCYPTMVDEGGQYRWLWVDIESATPEQMHKSLQARRKSALGDVMQLSIDLSSYNDNNKYGAQIQMSFNFDEDIAEMSQPTDYPEEDEDDLAI